MACHRVCRHSCGRTCHQACRHHSSHCRAASGSGAAVHPVPRPFCRPAGVRCHVACALWASRHHRNAGLFQTCQISDPCRICRGCRILDPCRTCRTLTARRHCALDDPRAPRPADHHATRRGPCSWGDAGGPGADPCCGICPAVFHLVCHAETMRDHRSDPPTDLARNAVRGLCGRDAAGDPGRGLSRMTAQDGNPQPPSRRCR